MRAKRSCLGRGNGGWSAAAQAIGVLLMIAASHTLAAATAQIDAAVARQVIRGFGGATAFMPTTPLSDADLDTLFGNGSGQIGFTWLRIRLASDDAWRAVELANARGAHTRGASVIATPWSPPPAMKSNHDLVGRSLLPAAYADYAKYLYDFARYMATSGAPLYAISIQNEPDITVTYESCDWTPAQMLAFCRDQTGAITATKVIAPESFQFRQAMSDPLLNDAGAAANVDIIGGHIYGGGLERYVLAEAKHKEVWMTEHLDLSTDWTGALATGREIHECLATANFNAYFWWYLRRYYGPLAEDSTISKRGYVMAQFAKFIRPGYVRVDAAPNPTQGVFVSAYKRDKLVIVAINQNTGPVTQAFAVGHASVASLSSWTTSATVSLQPQAPVTVTGGTFTATLPGSSISTFVGDLMFAPPIVVASPQSRTIAADGTVVFDVTADAEMPTYQWQHDGIAIPGATSRLLTIAKAQSSDGGSYAVTVANSGGAITSSPARLTVTSTAVPGRLVNLSTRSLVAGIDAVQIAGFVIGGDTSRTVLVRATGPTLQTAFGLGGVVNDPTVELYEQSTASRIAANDDWAPALSPTFRAVGAFGWPAGSKDAALVATLPPGAYSVVVRGKDEAPALALVEVYDAEPTGAGATLVNLSTRSLVGTDNEAQIAGFTLVGETAKTVVLRAAGPTLRKAFRVGNTLADPVIELRRQADGTLLATSDDWNADLAAHFAAVGAFAWPTESHDAALVQTLEPGQYSVVVRGVGDTTGVALVEIYAEP